MIRAIIFDCFGVLYHGSLEHLRDLTPDLRKDELMNLSRSSDYGYVSYEDYIQQASQLTGKTTQEVATIIKAEHVRNPAMIDLIRSLQGKYKIGLLSNVGRDIINHLFTPQELEELFDVTVLSSDVGVIKPHPEIYQLAAERLGVLPEECIMIDDMAINIDGAKATGMEGIVFSGTQECITALGQRLAYQTQG